MNARLWVFVLLLVGLTYPGPGRAAGADEATVQVRVKRILLDPSSKTPVVVLENMKEDKFIPIWIGKAEATSIALELEHVQVPRPNTHDLIRNIVEGLGAALYRITITELKDSTYFATITLKLKGQEYKIDSRPSDAIAVALRMGAPIFVSPEVLARAGRLPGFPQSAEGVRKTLGIHIQNLTEDLAAFFDLKRKGGVLVAHVEMGGAASKAGFQKGDVIMDINGQAIDSVEDVESLVKKAKKPARLNMHIRRKGKAQTVVLRLPS